MCSDRATRDDAVAAQYETATAASGYAAAYEEWGPTARYFHSRLYVVDQALDACPGGRLLDAGCGPGVLIRHLLDTRPGAFTITGCDRSPAMIGAAAERAGDDGARVAVARVEDMPFPDESFDVVTATGVLEYTDIRQALREVARVVRPGGLVVVTMLNPLSPYRLVEWFLYWPALRLLGRIERLVTGAQRHGAPVSGIRAVPPARLRRLVRDADLHVTDLVHYDVTPLIPPLDRVVRRWRRRWSESPERTVSRGFFRGLGTAYLLTARREHTP